MLELSSTDIQRLRAAKEEMTATLANPTTRNRKNRYTIIALTAIQNALTDIMRDERSINALSRPSTDVLSSEQI